MKIFKFGKVLVKCKTNKTKLLDFMLKNNMTCIKITETDECVDIVILKKDLNLLEEILSQQKIEYKIIQMQSGFSKHLNLNKRIGLMLGGLFFILCVYASSKIVWRIDINGNENVSDDEILEELRAVGFREGSYIPSIDYDDLHNSFLKESSNISWVSINVNGNVATVNVREKKNSETTYIPKYSNIVAKSDGQIVSIIVMNGKKIVNINDVVKKGDILISGVMESQAEGVRYVDSNGKILASVSKQINIKIPLKQTIVDKSGAYFEENSLKIFNNIIFFSRKYGNQYEIYDTIQIDKKINFFGINNLPIESIATKYYELEEKEVIYSNNQAVDLAFVQLREELDTILETAEITSKNIETSFDGEYVYLSCYLTCLEDICEKVEFKVEN